MHSCYVFSVSPSGLETVSRPVFETSRSHLVNFVGTSSFGLVSDIKSRSRIGLGHEGLDYSEK